MRFFVAAVVVLAVACRAQAQEPAVATADVYLFNDSGRTLIPSDQVVTDNGKKVASLPRQTFVKLQFAPGTHLLKPKPALWKQHLSLDVLAGRTYYVVVAYKPERSWAVPFAGAPLILREITEEEAAPLLRDFAAQ